jgi:hypothetical protein
MRIRLRRSAHCFGIRGAGQRLPIGSFDVLGADGKCGNGAKMRRSGQAIMQQVRIDADQLIKMCSDYRHTQRRAGGRGN